MKESFFWKEIRQKAQGFHGVRLETRNLDGLCDVLFVAQTRFTGLLELKVGSLVTRRAPDPREMVVYDLAPHQAVFIHQWSMAGGFAAVAIRLKGGPWSMYSGWGKAGGFAILPGRETLERKNGFTLAEGEAKHWLHPASSLERLGTILESQK